MSLTNILYVGTHKRVKSTSKLVRLQASTLTAGPAGVFHSGGQSGQWTKESAGPKGPAIISSDHKVFVLHWPEV